MSWELLKRRNFWQCRYPDMSGYRYSGFRGAAAGYPGVFSKKTASEERERAVALVAWKAWAKRKKEKQEQERRAREDDTWLRRRVADFNRADYEGVEARDTREGAAQARRETDAPARPPLQPPQGRQLQQRQQARLNRPLQE
jgi:hypothetical protein